MLRLPSLVEINSTAAFISSFLPPTPQYQWPLLCNRSGTQVWVKHENTTPIGSFKLRGGIHYLSNIRHSRVITATRGNHGQSVAYAAGLFGKSATVVCPHGNSASKNAAMRALDAELIEYGRDFSEAHEYARQQARQQGLHFVPSFDRELVVGVASYAMELFLAVPFLNVVYVPIGLGSEICAVIAAREALGIDVEIIGVVAENAPTYALSFEQRKVVTTESADTLADGIAVRVPNRGALKIILKYVSRIVRVSELQIASAMRHFFTDTHHVVEGAGASTLAALLKEKELMAGKRVAIIASGGNVDLDLYVSILNQDFPKPQS